MTGVSTPLAALPDRISVYEVGPRDGLQNEPAAVGTVSKLRLIEALARSGSTSNAR